MRTLAVMALVMAVPVVAGAQEPQPPGVRIGLTYAAGTKPGIIVMPVDASAGDSVRTMLERDFDFSDRFTVISLDTATLRGLSPRAGRFNYPLFARLGAAAIVVARPTPEGVRVVLHDVAAARQVGAEEFVLPTPRYAPEWRMAVHGLTDEVERWMLGKRGIARTRILFARGGSIYIVDSDGANAHRVTSGGTAMSPAWHPNGRLIAYSRLTDEGTRIVLHDLGAGARQTVRASSSSLNITPVFSPDGSQLVYATGRGGGTEIVSTPVTQPASARLVTVGRGSDNTSPSFSPDGRQIAFTSGRAGQPEVYIADADGTNVRLMTEFTYGGTSYRASPAWSPDGRFIAYQAQAGGFQIMLLSLRDRAVRQLTSAGSNEDPSWAPDAAHVVFTSTRSGVKQLWVMDVESGRLRQLTHTAGARLAAWSPPLSGFSEQTTVTGARE